MVWGQRHVCQRPNLYGCLWLEVLFVLAVGVKRHGECGLHLTLSNGTPLDGSAFLSKMLAFFFFILCIVCVISQLGLVSICLAGRL